MADNSSSSESGDSVDATTPPILQTTAASMITNNSTCYDAFRLLLLSDKKQYVKGAAVHLASAQMLQLVAATAQSEADTLRRAAVLELVERLLAAAFPFDVTLHCFGSSANGLGTSDSDLDIHLGKQGKEIWYLL